VRAIRLARVLRARVCICVDGPVPRMDAAPAVRFVSGGTRLLSAHTPQLLVLDTPVEADARRWLRAARRVGVPVASVHDRGIAPVASDLAIDGSLAGVSRVAGARHTLKGPRYMVVDPAVAGRRTSTHPGRSVIVAFGGGTRAILARQVAAAVRQRVPDATVRIAGGFAAGAGHRPSRGIEWLGPQPSLVPLLATASAAVVAGGVTLYEAAALGIPVVAMPVVPAQRPTVRAFAQAGLALRAVSASGAGASVARLMQHPSLGRVMRLKGPQVVDGRGVHRVALALESLMAERAR
jgi:hypothetical protein